MIKAEIIYNKAQGKTEFFFPDYECCPCKDFYFLETVVVNTDACSISNELRNKIKRHSYYLDGRCRDPSGRFAWVPSQTGYVSNKGNTEKRIRILDEEASRAQPNIIYTKNTNNVTISFMRGTQACKRFTYKMTKVLSAESVQVLYGMYIERNREALESLGFKELLSISPFDADKNTIDYLKDDEIFDYFNFVREF